ncbi:hypothetical protein GCM10020254_21650 [Streptomyces goshikiensis]
MEERTLHEVADVGDAGDVRVDHGVQLAVHLDLEPGGGEGVAVTDGVDAAGIGRGQLLGDAAQGPQGGGRVRVEGGAQPALVVVVGVLVRDEQGVRPPGPRRIR